MCVYVHTRGVTFGSFKPCKICDSSLDTCLGEYTPMCSAWFSIHPAGNTLLLSPSLQLVPAINSLPHSHLLCTWRPKRQTPADRCSLTLTLFFLPVTQRANSAHRRKRCFVCFFFLFPSFSFKSLSRQVEHLCCHCCFLFLFFCLQRHLFFFLILIFPVTYEAFNFRDR